MEIMNQRELCQTNAPLGMTFNVTIEDRLIRRKNELERQLKEVNDALNALQASPDTMEIINLISKVSY